MLSDVRVRNAKSGGRPIKLSDAGGLHLLVQPHGSKLWRMAYRFDGKQRTLALGMYPIVTLQEAREQRDGAKRLLAKGIDPSARRRLDKQTTTTSNTFKSVAEEVLEKLEKEGRAPRTLEKLHGYLILHTLRLVNCGSLKSPHQNCFRCCVRWKHAGGTKPRAGCAAHAAWSFGMPLPRVGQSGTHQLICGVP